MTSSLPRTLLLITMSKKKIGRPTQTTPASATVQAPDDWMDMSGKYPKVPTKRPQGMPQDLFDALQEANHLPDLFECMEKYGLKGRCMSDAESFWKMKFMLRIRSQSGRAREVPGSAAAMRSAEAMRVCLYLYLSCSFPVSQISNDKS